MLSLSQSSVALFVAINSVTSLDLSKFPEIVGRSFNVNFDATQLADALLMGSFYCCCCALVDNR